MVDAPDGGDCGCCVADVFVFEPRAGLTAATDIGDEPFPRAGTAIPVVAAEVDGEFVQLRSN